MPLEKKMHSFNEDSCPGAATGVSKNNISQKTLSGKKADSKLSLEKTFNEDPSVK